jgi:class 3 adenylate cyclase
VDSSRSLPSGVVTFLLTDIEGSTRLWEREPDRMRAALGRHDAVVNACVRRQNGHVVKSKGEGDSVFAVFEHARDAVTAALVLQCALAAEAWPTSTPIRVRVAVHTGQIEVHNGDYNGVSVNRCARLRALASGGQVLLSGVTAQLTQGQLPAGAGLTDLGSHQLKDLSAPERVWQLTHPRMPDSLPAATGPNVAESSAAQRVVTGRTAYVLTDELNHSADGREWGRGVKHSATGLDEDDEDGHIDCYTSPNVAALLNAQNERFRRPRLWAASVAPDFTSGEAVVGGRQVTTSQLVPIPNLTGMHHARFAVLCVRAVYAGGSDEATEFGYWAEGWLNGQDRSGIHARAVASMLEAAADRGTVVGHPEGMMAANAARSAMHAAGLSLRGGREHAEETARAIHFATEAVRTALRMKRLDLPALADQAINSVVPRR